MSKKVKIVDIELELNNHNKVMDTATEEQTQQEEVEEKPIEETVVEPGPIIEQAKEEEPHATARDGQSRPAQTETPKNDDEIKINEIIKEAAEKPKKERKTVTCPKCSKVLLEKNYKYSHQSVCGKVKVKPVREDVAQDPTPKPTEPIQPPPPPVPDFWELRRQYNNQLKDRKTQLVKKLVSKAF